MLHYFLTLPSRLAHGGRTILVHGCGHPKSCRNELQFVLVGPISINRSGYSMLRTGFGRWIGKFQRAAILYRVKSAEEFGSNHDVTS